MKNGLVLAVLALALSASWLTESFGYDLTLAWDAPASANATGYKVYYGTSSGSYTSTIEIGNQTVYTINGLIEGETYYFAVTAFNSYGESGYSNELVYQASSPVSAGGYLLWNTHGQAKLFELDASYQVSNIHTYNLDSGWYALSVTRNIGGIVYILFQHTSGVTVLWEMSPDLSTYVDYCIYYPDLGWRPISLEIDKEGFGIGYLSWWNSTQGLDITWVMEDYETWSSYHSFNICCGWRPISTSLYGDFIYRMFVNTNGQANIWEMEDWSGWSSYRTFGPYAGYSPVNFVVSQGVGYLLWTSPVPGQAILWLMEDLDWYSDFRVFNLPGFTPVWYYRN